MVNFNFRESKRIWSVNEVIEMLEEEEFLQADIFLSPPNNGLLFNEDSDDKEAVSANHLSGPQLSAPAEFCINFDNSFKNTLEWDLSAVEASFDVSDNALSSSVCKIGRKLASIAEACNILHFLEKKRINNKSFYDLPSRNLFKNFLSPTAILELYFNEEVINYLTEMTNLYANRDKGKHSFHVDHSEMHLFVAMLLLSGYNVLPCRCMYWENSEDVYNESMSCAMSYNRFEEILSALHCSDNYNLDLEDKMAKI